MIKTRCRYCEEANGGARCSRYRHTVLIYERSKGSTVYIAGDRYHLC